ncbi:FAD-dependent monooxygenase [Kineococcus sp. G2]|uniref:FAD-dependent monooxygenase n=1 Tax=Kineococcus sp. G2 TaxID=3127484 RepID=UPI00301D24A4
MRGRALIAGGGIAGLATARALLRGGWDVEVRERAAGPPATGTSLGMWPHAVAALRELGLDDLVQGGTAVASSGELLRPDGRVLVRLEPRDAVHLVDRPTLLAALAAGLPDGAVRWGTPAPHPGDLPPVDAVVAADGIGSALRRARFGPAAAPRPLGTAAVRGTADAPCPQLAETWGRGRMFGTTPRRDGRTNVYACFRTPVLPVEDVADPRAALREVFTGWHPGVTGAIEALDPGSLDVRVLHDVRPLRSTTTGNVALVGDAAHAMAPHLGRGACEALADAVALARHLLAAADVPTALRGYDRERRRATARVVRASRVLNSVSTAQHLTGARDAALALAGRAAAGFSARR